MLVQQTTKNKAAPNHWFQHKSKKILKTIVMNCSFEITAALNTSAELKASPDKMKRQHREKTDYQWDESNHLQEDLNLRCVAVWETLVPLPSAITETQDRLIISLIFWWKAPNQMQTCQYSLLLQTWIGVEIHGVQRKMCPLLSWCLKEWEPRCRCWPLAPQSHFFICSSSVPQRYLSPAVPDKMHSAALATFFPAPTSHFPPPHITLLKSQMSDMTHQPSASTRSN